MNRKVSLGAGVILLAVALLLAACGGSSAPASTPVPTQAKVPVPATEPPPTAVPTPASAIPDGWVERSSGDVKVWLPKEWNLVDFSKGDMESMYADLEKTNPDLAKLVGSADALVGISLWAFSPVTQGVDFVDNVNVRRQSLEGQKLESLSQSMVDIVTEELKKASFEDVTGKPDLQVNGRPAAYLTYTVPTNVADGKSIKLNARQWMILTDTDMWVVTYMSGPGSALDIKEAFEANGLSFSVK